MAAVEKSRSPELERFARNFRNARRSAHLSQRDVHRRTGLAVSYVSGVEGGRNISIDKASLLADAVGVPLHQLLAP